MEEIGPSKSGISYHKVGIGRLGSLPAVLCTSSCLASAIASSASREQLQFCGSRSAVKANMKVCFRAFLILLCFARISRDALAQGDAVAPSFPAATSRRAAEQHAPLPPSANYRALQQRLAQGWNTWDTNSVTTQVLLPEGLAIHFGLKHNTALNTDAFLGDVLIGRLQPGAEQVVPGPHAWDGSYTDLRVT